MINPAQLATASSRLRRDIYTAVSFEAASGCAAHFWDSLEPVVGAEVRRLFDAEVAYLWAAFPDYKKTLAKYQELLAVLAAQTADVAWYASYPRYGSAGDVLADRSLCRFERRRSDFDVKWSYVRYYQHPLMRVPNALRLRYRRMVNHPGRYTQGLGTTRCTPAIAALLNHICEQVERERSGKPIVLLVNSVLRTLIEQQALARIGYVAPRTSSHLNGYAADIEQTWYRRHNPAAYRAIAGVLAGLLELGEINVIDEETHWHICLNPAYIPRYEAAMQRWMEPARCVES